MANPIHRMNIGTKDKRSQRKVADSTTKLDKTLPPGLPGWRRQVLLGVAVLALLAAAAAHRRRRGEGPFYNPLPPASAAAPREAA